MTPEEVNAVGVAIVGPCPWFCEVYDGGSPDGELVYCDRPAGHDDQHYHPDAWLSDSGWELDPGAVAL